jgi:hypothetical protein
MGHTWIWSKSYFSICNPDNFPLISHSILIRFTRFLDRFGSFIVPEMHHASSMRNCFYFDFLEKYFPLPLARTLYWWPNTRLRALKLGIYASGQCRKGFQKGWWRLERIKYPGKSTYPLQPSPLFLTSLCISQSSHISFRVAHVYTPCMYNFGWCQKAQ